MFYSKETYQKELNFHGYPDQYLINILMTKLKREDLATLKNFVKLALFFSRNK